MSIVVEALTLIVRRPTLDASYPGGADAYLEMMAGEPFKARWTCANADLTAVSFLTDDIIDAVKHLLEHNLVMEDDGAFVDAAIIDEMVGPTLPCEWLEWKCDQEMLTVAWLSGEDAGEPTKPDGFTPSFIARSDIRDEDFMFKLSEEDGVETWLDTRSSRVIRGPADPQDKGSGPMMSLVRGVLEDRGWPYTMHGPRVARACFQAVGLLHQIEIKVQEDAKVIRCRGLLPLFVPYSRRSAVHALLESLNMTHYYHAHELDRDDGRVWNWFIVDATDGMTSKVVAEILDEVRTLCRAATRVVLPDMTHWAVKTSRSSAVEDERSILEIIEELERDMETEE